MISLTEQDLHPNAVIPELCYEDKFSTDSMLPNFISVNSIELIPIFEADFSKLCRLYRYTSPEVFQHYGSTLITSHTKLESMSNLKKRPGEMLNGLSMLSSTKESL